MLETQSSWLGTATVLQQLIWVIAVCHAKFLPGLCATQRVAPANKCQFLILQVYSPKVWKGRLLLVLKTIVMLHAALLVVRKILYAAAPVHAPMENVCVCLAGQEPTVACAQRSANTAALAVLLPVCVNVWKAGRETIAARAQKSAKTAARAAMPRVGVNVCKAGRETIAARAQKRVKTAARAAMPRVGVSAFPDTLARSARCLPVRRHHPRVCC